MVEGITAEHAKALLILVTQHELRSRPQEAATRAVQMLEELAKQSPSDARIRSDLAAAYVVRAQRTDRPQDLLHALEAIEDAVRLAPDMPAARFNQAMIHESLTQRQTAKKAWRLFLALEPVSGWAEEARTRLEALHASEKNWPETRQALIEAAQRQEAALMQGLIEPFRSMVRRYSEEELLPAWAEALGAGNVAEAERQLDAAQQYGDILADLGGDTLLAEAVAVIDAAAPEFLGHLVAGHRAYGEAARHLAAIDLPKACPRFEDARRELSYAGSPFQAWAIVGLATCRFYRHEYQEALRLLEPIRQGTATDAEVRSKRANVLGRAAWIAALSESVLAHPLEALHAYQQSLAWFETTGERENVTSVHARLADLLRHMGEGEQAWRHRYQALRGHAHLQEPKGGSLILFEAGTATMELGLPTSALLLHDAALSVAREAQDEALLAIVLAQHADNSLQAGRPEEALQDLREAFELSQIIAAPEVQTAIQARIREVEGDLWHDPLRAIDSLTAALRLLPRGVYPHYRARLFVKRGRSLSEVGRAEEAEADLKESLRALEAEWKQVLTRRRRGIHEGLWSTYFAYRRETFDLMISLVAEQGREEQALSYFERARARELLDLIADLPLAQEEVSFRSSRKDADELLHPMTAKTIREQIPSNLVLIEFAQLDDRLLIWEIRHGRTRLHTQHIGRGRMDELAGTIRAFVGRDATIDIHSTLEELHEILLGPLIADLDEGEQLVFIPDGPLQSLPFAALRRPETGRFLVQDHVLSIAPSATVFLSSLRRDEGLPRSEAPSALLVGNPAFDRQRYQQLEDLPEALIETRQVAQYYSDPVLLEGAAATKPRFLAELGRHEIVHFAGHAIPHPGFLYQSSLVLAPSEDEPGVLYAKELLLHDLGRTRLVIFSACSTVGGHPIGSLSVSGLVRPVLGAGVPAVIGTLWDVKSSAAAQLLTAFHRHLNAGTDAARALRMAQLEMLDGNLAQRSIKSWAPFQLIGVASFTHLKERSPS